MSNARKLQSKLESTTGSIEIGCCLLLLERVTVYSHFVHVSIECTAEIDRVLKKVDEGAELFDETWLKGKNGERMFCCCLSVSLGSFHVQGQVGLQPRYKPV